MEVWKDGRMEGWKDGRMEGWKDGTKNRMQKERETKKRAKGIYKSEPPRRAQKANF